MKCIIQCFQPFRNRLEVITIKDDKIFDGEKYLIELDVNHKRKKYKIQNKFPDNWDEFLDIKQDIMAFDKE